MGYRPLYVCGSVGPTAARRVPRRQHGNYFWDPDRERQFQLRYLGFRFQGSVQRAIAASDGRERCSRNQSCAYQSAAGNAAAKHSFTNRPHISRCFERRNLALEFAAQRRMEPIRPGTTELRGLLALSLRWNLFLDDPKGPISVDQWSGHYIQCRRKHALLRCPI